MLVPCESDGLKIGLLCREYIYKGEDVTHYYNHYYNSHNQLVKKSLLVGNGANLQDESYTYNSINQLIEESKYNPSSNADTLHQYSYNLFDSLNEKSTYVSNNLVGDSFYLYNENNQISTITNYRADTVYSFTNYTYLTDKSIYKIIDYAADTTITTSTQYTYYTNDLVKIEYYNGNALSSYDLLVFENDTLIKRSIYDSTHTLDGYYLYVYDNYHNINNILFYNESDLLISSREFTYYY
jgi:hypothetical protein